jgi:hypothetical protein
MAKVIRGERFCQERLQEVHLENRYLGSQKRSRQSQWNVISKTTEMLSESE